MNETLRQTAIFTRDLMGRANEEYMSIGRDGADIKDFNDPWIAIDTLGPSQRLATGEVFDGTSEVMTYAQQWVAPVTVSFYGPDAWADAAQFAALIPSEKSNQLQVAQGIGVFQAGGLTDIKLLAGRQYEARVEVTLNIQYAIAAEVDTLRIDTAILEVRTERGLELEP